MNKEVFNYRFYEISSKKAKGGKRPVKVILHEIMPDNTIYQENGISWNEEYTLNSLESLVGAPIIVEFVDENKTIIWGHGSTDEVETEDGKMPVFENSEVVGAFTSGYIEDIVVDNETKRVLIGEGYIYEHRYYNFTKWLIENVPLGNVMGSVEIVGLPENNNKIIYENGWVEKGRVPKDYMYSGYALLNQLVDPADPVAKVLEINQNKNEGAKKEEIVMDEKILAQLVENIKNVIVETNSKNTEAEGLVAEKEAKIVELNASVVELTSALESAEKERKELWDKEESLYKEIKLLKEEVTKAKIAERISELNSAIADFSDEEKGYAKAEIEAFNADPVACEINSVVDKIYAEIGKKKREEDVEAARVSELNNKADLEKPEDIFSEVFETNSKKEEEDTNIF